MTDGTPPKARDPTCFPGTPGKAWRGHRRSAPTVRLQSANQSPHGQHSSLESRVTQHVFTRADLYALVWKEPMRTIAKRLGVSDVGLAKACRRHGVPAPERGHWAKLHAGKTVSQPPLPEHPGLDRVVIAPAAPRPRRARPARGLPPGAGPPSTVIPATGRRAIPS
jgi:hypothetical protein